MIKAKNLRVGQLYRYSNVGDSILFFFKEPERRSPCFGRKNYITIADTFLLLTIKPKIKEYWLKILVNETTAWICLDLDAFGYINLAKVE